MRELPIKRPIARVAVEAHRYRIIVVCSLRRTDWMTITCVVVRRRSCAIDMVAAWRGRRHLTLRRLFRRGRDPSQCELRVGGGLRRSDQLADGVLGDAQPLRDRAVAHPLALQHLDAAQAFAGDTSSAAAPSFLSTE